MSSEARACQLRTVLAELAAWSRAFETAGAPPFAGARLNRSQLDTLFYLAHAHSPVTPSALARHLGVTAGAATQIIDTLAAQGLVNKSPHPADARSRIIALSSTATEIVNEAESGFARRLAPRFAQLSDDELRLLASLLTRTSKEAE